MRTRASESGPVFASLFCGCGGFDLGFAQAGFRCVGAFDIDPLAVGVHQRNLPGVATVCDLTQDLPSFGTQPKVDVLLSGSPCQGFSTVGKRDLADPRNSLLLVGGHIAVRMRPRVFIAENVSGVVAGDHRQYWDALHETMRAAGYRTADIRCDAQRLGVAQRRRRMIMVAWKGKGDIRTDLPQKAGGVVGTVLRGVVGVSNHHPERLRMDTPMAIIARHIRQGQKLSNVRSGPRAVHTWEIPGVYGHTSAAERRALEAFVKLRRQNRVRTSGDADPVSAHALSSGLGMPVRRLLQSLIAKGYVRRVRGAFDLTHTFNGKYRRLALDAPSPTVDTRFGDPRCFLHPTSDRGLTVREAARIQGFPDSFLFEGPTRAQFRLIGNAVPPPMAAQIALWVRQAILEGQ